MTSRCHACQNHPPNEFVQLVWNIFFKLSIHRFKLPADEVKKTKYLSFLDECKNIKNRRSNSRVKPKKFEPFCDLHFRNEDKIRIFKNSKTDVTKRVEISSTNYKNFRNTTRIGTPTYHENGETYVFCWTEIKAGAYPQIVKAENITKLPPQPSVNGKSFLPPKTAKQQNTHSLQHSSDEAMAEQVSFIIQDNTPVETNSVLIHEEQIYAETINNYDRHSQTSTPEKIIGVANIEQDYAAQIKIPEQAMDSFIGYQTTNINDHQTGSSDLKTISDIHPLSETSLQLHTLNSATNAFLPGFFIQNSPPLITLTENRQLVVGNNESYSTVYTQGNKSAVNYVSNLEPQTNVVSTSSAPSTRATQAISATTTKQANLVPDYHDEITECLSPFLVFNKNKEQTNKDYAALQPDIHDQTLHLSPGNETTNKEDHQIAVSFKTQLSRSDDFLKVPLAENSISNTSTSSQEHSFNSYSSSKSTSIKTSIQNLQDYCQVNTASNFDSSTTKMDQEVINKNSPILISMPETLGNNSPNIFLRQFENYTQNNSSEEFNPNACNNLGLLGSVKTFLELEEPQTNAEPTSYVPITHASQEISATTTKQAYLVFDLPCPHDSVTIKEQKKVFKKPLTPVTIGPDREIPCMEMENSQHDQEATNYNTSPVMHIIPAKEKSAKFVTELFSGFPNSANQSRFFKSFDISADIDFSTPISAKEEKLALELEDCLNTQFLHGNVEPTSSKTTRLWPQTIVISQHEPTFQSDNSADKKLRKRKSSDSLELDNSAGWKESEPTRNKQQCRKWTSNCGQRKHDWPPENSKTMPQPNEYQNKLKLRRTQSKVDPRATPWSSRHQHTSINLSSRPNLTSQSICKVKPASDHKTHCTPNSSQDICQSQTTQNFKGNQQHAAPTSHEMNIKQAGFRICTDPVLPERQQHRKAEQRTRNTEVRQSQTKQNLNKSQPAVPASNEMIKSSENYERSMDLQVLPERKQQREEEARKRKAMGGQIDMNKQSDELAEFEKCLRVNSK